MNQYIITEEDIHCLFDYFQAALDGEENKKALKRLFDQQCGVMRSHPYQSERDKVLDELTRLLDEHTLTYRVSPDRNIIKKSFMYDIIAELRQVGEP